MKMIRMATPKTVCCPTRMFWTVVRMADGNITTIPAKISNDIPLPIPRSVICSPSHMMKTVPAVIVRIVISVNANPGSFTRFIPSGRAWLCREDRNAR